MSERDAIIVYTLEFCPNCEILKEYLTTRNIPFAEASMASPESLTELRINGVFVSEAPVLQVGTTFLTSADLFSGGKIKDDRLQMVIPGR